MHLQQTAFENIVGKGEIARNKQFLLFSQCFLLNQIIVSPFVHIFDIISLFAADLEEPKIGISGKGLNSVLSILQLGEWVFVASGTGLIPQAQDPVSIFTVAGSNVTLIIPFRNPMDYPVLCEVMLRGKLLSRIKIHQPSLKKKSWKKEKKYWFPAFSFFFQQFFLLFWTQNFIV